MTTPHPPVPQAGPPQDDPTPAGGAGTPTTEAGSGRSGYLYRKVALHLADHPDDILKVGEITRAIGAPSSGAVFEALKKMAAAGHATHHRDPHHRFQITQAGIDAAGTLPPAAPRTHSGGSSGGGGRQSRPAPVPRPNGTLYHPRRLGRGWDVEELRRLRAQQVPVLLYGPPGTGKTAMVEAAFPDLLTVAGTGDTVVDDFLGSYNPIPGGGYEFVHGPLVTAMREGRVLLVDDATLIPSRVLAVPYPAMDGRGVITIPPTATRPSRPSTGSTSSPATTRACTARCSPRPWPPGSPSTCTSPPTGTSPANSASPSPWSPRRSTSTPTSPPARPCGRRSCVNCSAS
jgi:nitric oxide reductase NorQ protein